jgi:DNA ligase-1
MKIQETAEPLHYYIEGFEKALKKKAKTCAKGFVLDAWRDMTAGRTLCVQQAHYRSFRIGVSQALMVNALAKTVNLPSSEIAHRISGNWDPATITLMNC